MHWTTTESNEKWVYLHISMWYVNSTAGVNFHEGEDNDKKYNYFFAL